MTDITSEDEILAILQPEERRTFFSFGSKRSFKVGEIILNQGDENDCLMVVLSGRLAAYCRSTLTRVPLDDVTAGQSLGEMSVLNPDRVSVTVKGKEPGELFSISRHQLDAFLADHPVTGNRILKHLGAQVARRLRRANAELIRNSEGRFGFDHDF